MLSSSNSNAVIKDHVAGFPGVTIFVNATLEVLFFLLVLYLENVLELACAGDQLVLRQSLDNPSWVCLDLDSLSTRLSEKKGSVLDTYLLTMISCGRFLPSSC